ncbi:clustered mitochondria protein homolog [Ambystoma mexicanum]|uniref:clustered mitochondria protein homolog n=1 Tax=Ambystoma mexicanum TaxID=8296 RepID=UPI0037E8502A
MNEIYKNGSNANIKPLKFTAPSMSSVLELLNTINGILFIPLSQKDMDNLRAEVQQRHILHETIKGNHAHLEVEDPLKKPEPKEPCIPSTETT